MPLRIGADGVHLAADADAYRRSAQARLGNARSWRRLRLDNRHDAMLLAEMGADYVAFGPTTRRFDAIDQRAELIAWWTRDFHGALRRLGTSKMPEEAARLRHSRRGFRRARREPLAR